MTDAVPRIAYRWSPIQPLDVIVCSYDFSEIDSLQRQWLSIKERREASNPDAYRAFLDRLDRSWAIETGIIEGLYTLDRGVTETLVLRGFNAELIGRNDTNKDPTELVSVLEDHRQAAEGVYGYIREGNPLTKSFIRQLHVILTEHLPTYTAYDQFGNRFETLLDRGGFKTLPNNPTRPDGRIHEYCPPVQVDSEIDNLVEWHAAHRGEGYHPLLIAAWLHHTFTQIHPFQDGNGRVARALLTWHLVREGFLSVVVSRDDRTAYIEALEKADAGKLAPFIDFLVQLQKNTIQEALAEPNPIERSHAINQVATGIARQIQQRNIAEQNRLRSVTEVAQSLRDRAADYLTAQAEQLSQALHETDMPIRYSLEDGGPGNHEGWYHTQVVRTAQETGHWANLNEPRFFVKLSLIPDGSGRHPALSFVLSLHHTGRQLTGIMAATAFLQVDFYPNYTSVNSDTASGVNYWICLYDAFTFTWENDANSVEPRFFDWIEVALLRALDHWQDFLS